MRLVWMVVFAIGCDKASSPATGTASGSMSGFASGSAPAAPKCKSDVDCVIACDKPGDCCDTRWCETVQHKDVLAATMRANVANCEGKQITCNDVVRPKPAQDVTGRCQSDGTCVAVKIDRSPERLDHDDYDRACKTARDCAIVKLDPCNWCTCPRDAIAAAELPRFNAARAKIECPEDARMCKKCDDDWSADCVIGRCIATKQ